MDSYKNTKEENKVSTLWKKEEQEEISKIDTTCKSHSDVKVAEGECCQTKEKVK